MWHLKVLCAFQNLVQDLCLNSVSANCYVLAQTIWERDFWWKQDAIVLLSQLKTE